jgi:hypothetical protein
MLIVCANHERLMLQRPVEILHRDTHTLTVRLEDGVHTVAFA